MVTSSAISYRAWLMLVFVILLGLSAIKPSNWQDFMVEHVLTIGLLAALILLTRRRPLSNVAYTMIFVYLLLHLIGAHYTYSLVPYDRWVQWLFGEGASISRMFGWQRNHFDRMVHVLWGALLWLPMREMLQWRLAPSQPGASLMAICVLATLSASYEILEWLFTIVMSPEAAATYNGQQGDVFDAQKDEALALCGSVGAALVLSRTRLVRARSMKSKPKARRTQR